MVDAPGDFKYPAFISYSHRDKKWGQWLHRLLETYRVPKHLVGKAGRHGPVPARLFPIFRDREELPVSADLTATIQAALEQSAFLIVICSPAAAKSRWVNEEVLAFKRLGRGDRILTFIAEGEPHATDPEEECFPPALRFEVTETGHASSATEGIAADARHNMDGRENASLKLIAALLGVDYDQLKRRDHERRVRRLQIWTTCSLLLVLLFIGLGIALFFQRNYAREQEQLAVEQRQRAEAALAETQRTLSRADFSRALQLIEQQQLSVALAYLARALRTDPRNRRAAELTWSLLLRENWILPVAPPLILGEAAGAKLTPAGDAVLTWDSETWAMQRTDDASILSGPFAADTELFFLDAAFDHAGELLATPTYFSREPPAYGVRVFDPLTGHEPYGPFHLEGVILEGFSVASARFSPDGQKLATTVASSAPIFRLDDPETPLHVYTADGTINLVGYSNAGDRIFTTCLTELSIWDSETFATAEHPPSPLSVPSLIQGVSFSPDDRLIVVFLWANSTIVFDAASGERLDVQIEHQNYLCGVRFLEAREGLMSASVDGVVRFSDPETGSPLAAPLELPTPLVTAGLREAWEQLLTVAVVAPDSLCRLQAWDLAPSRAKPLSIEHLEEVSAVRFSPDGATVATGSRDGQLRLSSALDGTPRQEPLLYLDPIRELAFSADAKRLLVASGRTLDVVELATGEPMDPRREFPHPVTSVALSPVDDRIAIGCEDGSVFAFSLGGGETGPALYQHEEAVGSLAFSADGTRLLSGSEDNFVRCWDFGAGTEAFPPLRHEDDLTSAIYAPDGGTILTTSHDDTARLWDASTGEPRGTPLRFPLGGVDRDVHAGQFQPGGEAFLTIHGEFGTPGAAVLWSSATGRRLSNPMEHPEGVHAAAFSPSGSLVVTGSFDQQLRIWDPASGVPLGSPIPQEAPVTLIRFSPTGGQFATVSANAVRLWRVPLWEGKADPWLAPLAEYVGGRRLTDNETIELLPVRFPGQLLPELQAQETPNTPLAVDLILPAEEPPDPAPSG